ncbi:MAG: hypothetical protein ACXAD7_23505, partial [Candidatus Kariarchaeaceae archaeon]
MVKNLHYTKQTLIDTKDNFRVHGANYRAVFAIIRKRWQILRRYPLNLVFWLFAPVLWLLPTLIFGTILVGDRYSDNLERMTGIADIWV